MRRLTAFLVATTLAGFGCGDSLSPERSSGNPIINGTTADQPHHASVVSLHYDGSSNIFCSGTLVTPTVVVTAGHCLDVSDTSTPVTMDPSHLTIYFGSDPTSATEPYATNHVDVAQTWINPDYLPSLLLNDIALVRLATPAPAKAATAPYVGAGGLSAADLSGNGGAEFDFAGFGYSSSIARGPFNSQKSGINEKLHVLDFVDAFGCPPSICGGSGSDADYEAANPDEVATQMSYAQDGEGPCNGDSGGPAFVDRGGTWTLAGVTSYGDSQCLRYGASTRVDAFAGRIDTFIACTPTESTESVCDDGSDSDCDQQTDAEDPDCQTPPAPEPDPGVCVPGDAPAGGSCTDDSDCQSCKCKGKPGAKQCK